MMKIPQDIAFLKAQREKGRKGMMTSVDQKFDEKESRKAQKRAAAESRKEKAEQEKEMSTAEVVLVSSSNETESTERGTDSSDHDVSKVLKNDPQNKSKRARKNIVTSLAATLDRTQTSDRSATMVLTEAARSLGHDPE